VRTLKTLIRRSSRRPFPELRPASHSIRLGATAVLGALVVLLPADTTGGSGEPATARTEMLEAGELPVPRAESVVVDTDVTYSNFASANLFTVGNQWGSGYHQVANEWSWYINHAVGEETLWRIEGWEYENNNQTLVLNVRDGVTWNDGMPFTAEDIVFTINMLLETPELIGHDDATEWVESAEARDELTAVINLTSPNPRFHHQFRMWGGPLGQTVAKHVWEGEDPMEFANWPPVETGPYKLHSVHEDLGMFVWERRDDYWAEDLGFTPQPRYVVYRTAPPQDILVSEVIEGRTDAPLPHLFNWQLVSAAQAGSDAVVTAPFGDPNPVGIYGFNLDNPLLAERDGRWAIAMLLNREKLADLYPAAESSVPSPYPWPAPQWDTLSEFGPMAEGAMQRIEDEFGYRYEYDPDAAAALLDGLGYVMEGDTRVTPDGEPLSLELLTRPANQLEEFYIAEDLAAELRAIGVDATITSVNADVYLDTMREGSFDIAVGWVEGTPTAFAADIALGLDWWRWTEAKAAAQPETDYMMFPNPELDDVVRELMTLDQDDPAAQPLYEEGVYLLMREMLAAPAVEKMFVQTFTTNYWTGWPTSDDMYNVPYQWWPQFIFTLFELESTG
jgi:peptide/nickel transport system substrate-binding protein